MKKFLPLSICAGAIVLCAVMMLRYMANEKPAISIVAMVPQDSRAMEKSPLVFELTNKGSTDVRVVGLNWC